MTVFQDNIRLPSDIFVFLQKNCYGEVLLTTSKGIYLQFSSRIILLADKAYGISPIGIGLENFVDFATLIKPVVGQKVQVSDRYLHFPGGTLMPVWDVVETTSSHGYPVKEQVLRCGKDLLDSCSSRSLATLVAPLLLGQPLTAAANNNAYCLHALPILKGLLSAISVSNIDGIKEHIPQLLGFGLGLTPSMDDVLLGFLYGALRWMPQDGATVTLRDAIVNYAQSHTNAISAAYLTAVAQGAFFERLDNIMEGLCNSASVDITPILEIGSSSGSEMLFGLLLAAKIAMKG